MAPIGDYCLGRNQESRILNALWARMCTDWTPRPRDWHPEPVQVAELRLSVVVGLGLMGQTIVSRWLEDHGFPPPAKLRGPARDPSWQPQDKHLKRLKPWPMG